MKSTVFKPILAATLERVEDLHSWSNLVSSPKLDGIRCLIHNGQAVSRNLKPIPNRYIQEKLRGLPNGLDGELIVGSPTEGMVFNRTSSGVMSQDGKPDFMYHVFDFWPAQTAFIYRQAEAGRAIFGHPFAAPVRQVATPTAKDVHVYQDLCLKLGYEGVMVRRGDAPYKFGRATQREGYLWKLKQFQDHEGIVVAVLEGESNTNAATRDATGAIERSTHAAGMIPNGQVGTLVVNPLGGMGPVNVSPGRMTHDDRRKFWTNQDLIKGKIVKYRVFEYGAVDAPRFATFQGFRSEIDL